MDTRDNRCSVPFNGMTVISLHMKKVTPCCKIMPIAFDSELLTETHKEIRQSMLDNKRHKLCNECYKLEDSGGASHRNRITDNNFDYNQAHIDDPIESIQVIFSNKCQMMCSYCNSGFSSMWQEKQKKFIPGTNSVPIKLISENDQVNLEKLVDLDNLKWLRITGGEPLIQDQCVDFLLNLSPNPIRKIGITTNLSYGDSVMNTFLSIINRHDNITISCSLDAVGDNISRKYLNWELWQKNYKIIAENLQDRLTRFKNLKITTIITISILNYKNLQALVEYLLDYRKTGIKGTTFTFNYVSLDEKLSLKSNNLDMSSKIMLSDDYSVLLTPEEKIMIDGFNKLLNNVQLNTTLQNQTDTFLEWYNKI